MAQKVIAVIGAGGKTTALSLLAKQSGKEKVLITTTTKIYPMEGSLIDPTGEELAAALCGTVCAGSRAREGKLGILSPDVLETGLKTADLVVYEGDGANRRPLKLHKPYEPVILPETTHCLIVTGLSAWGRPVEEVIHRYELNHRWKKTPMWPVGPGEILQCIEETALASGLTYDRLRVFLNQTDMIEDIEIARSLAERLNNFGLKTKFGSLQKDADCLYDWLIEG